MFEVVPSAEPEFALRRAAGENDVREALDLTSDSLIGCLPHARRPIGRAARDCDQDVLLRPAAL
jgi:hypothetical protein